MQCILNHLSNEFGCDSHEIDGELTYIGNKDEKASGDVSAQDTSVSDVTAVEGVCNEMGFVMRTNQDSRCSNIVLCVVICGVLHLFTADVLFIYQNDILPEIIKIILLSII